MTATNDYQQFASSSGANVETQSSYLVDPTLANGMTSGVVPSTRLNKILRQATMACAALGQIIANSGQNAYDDGNVSNFAANLLSAIIGGVIPAGTIIAYAGTSAPTGYLACPVAATNISRTAYPNLFAAIGTTWGAGDGSTTFGVPYFPAGYCAISGTPGSVSSGQMPAHSHTFQSASQLGGGGGGGDVNGGGVYHTTSSAGTGTANLAAGSTLLMCVKY